MGAILWIAVMLVCVLLILGVITGSAIMLISVNRYKGTSILWCHLWAPRQWVLTIRRKFACPHGRAQARLWAAWASSAAMLLSSCFLLESCGCIGRFDIYKDIICLLWIPCFETSLPAWRQKKTAHAHNCTYVKPCPYCPLSTDARWLYKSFGEWLISGLRSNISNIFKVLLIFSQSYFTSQIIVYNWLLTFLVSSFMNPTIVGRQFLTDYPTQE